MLDWEYYPNCESALNGSIVIFKEYTIIKKDFFPMDHILINFIMLSMENTIIIKEYTIIKKDFICVDYILLITYLCPGRIQSL